MVSPWAKPSVDAHGWSTLCRRRQTPFRHLISLKRSSRGLAPWLCHYNYRYGEARISQSLGLVSYENLKMRCTMGGKEIHNHRRSDLCVSSFPCLQLLCLRIPKGFKPKTHGLHFWHNLRTTHRRLAAQVCCLKSNMESASIARCPLQH